MDALLDDEPVRKKKRKRQRPPPPDEPPFRDGDELWTWEHLIILTAITFLAGVLRLYKIDEWSFWIDEVHTLRDAVLNTSDEFWAAPTSRYPIGFLLVRWFQPWLPGAAEGSYRLIFAFFGIVSVPLLAVFARRMLGAGPALLAALLLALSPWHIYWSQSCRFYTVVLFFSLASMGAFRVGVERGHRGWLASGIVLAALAALTHPTAAMLFPTYCIYIWMLRSQYWVAWPERLNRGALLWIFVPLAIGGVVLGVVVLRAVGKYVEVKTGDVSFMHVVNTTFFFVRVPVILSALGGVLLLWHQSRRTFLYLLLLLVVPAAAVGLMSLRTKMSAQYLFLCLPVWCALAAYGAWEVTQRLGEDYAYAFRHRSRMAARAIVLGVLVLDLATQDHLYYHYRHGDRPRWREAAAYIETHGSPNDIVASTNEPSMEWYLNPSNPLRKRWDALGEKKVVEVVADWTLGRFDEWKAQADKHGFNVWVVLTEPVLDLNNPSKDRDVWLRQNFHQVLRLENWTGPKDMTVLVYRYTPKALEPEPVPRKPEPGN